MVCGTHAPTDPTTVIVSFNEQGGDSAAQVALNNQKSEVAQYLESVRYSRVLIVCVSWLLLRCVDIPSPLIPTDFSFESLVPLGNTLWKWLLSLLFSRTSLWSADPSSPTPPAVALLTPQAVSSMLQDGGESCGNSVISAFVLPLTP